MKRIIALIITAVAMGNTVSAKIERGYECHTTENGLMLHIDSIDYRKEVTRVFGRLLGQPHTSNRVDAVKLDGIHCCDMEGVDFNRYFQWEDDRQIAVELDFPPTKKPYASGNIQIMTPRGESTIKFTRKPIKSKK